MDDQAYLEPGFDPSTLTVPRLRSILVAHNVDYPSSSKKQQLIDLFNDNVLPQARKIRHANSRVKRTSRGIEDIGTGRRGTGAGDPDDDDIPPTPATGRSTRRTTRARTEEAIEVEPTPRGVRHSTAPPEGVTPRVVSGKHARTVATVKEEESEPEPKRVSRTPRFSAVTPRVKREDENSPFSSENVFQSGGSSELRNRSTDRRRTTLGNTAARDLERRHRELRRQTDGVGPVKRQMDGAVVPTRKTFEMPASAFKQEDIEPNEEFTPEESMEIIQAQQAGELVPATRRTKQAGSTAKVGVGAVLTVAIAALGALWGQEKFNVGYCGVGRPSTELAGVEIPPWADPIRPQCEPCPPHAYCHENLETECESGFVLTHHPLSMNGLIPIPIPPTCEPDSARARRVESVKAKAIETLRQRNAEFECGSATAPEVKETELKQAIATQRRKGMTNEEFEDLWAAAIGEVAQMDEVHSGSDGAGHAVLRSNSEAAIPLSCAIRRSLRQTLREYVWWVVAVLFVLSSGSYGRYRLVSGNETEILAKRFASLALERLSIQASLHAQDPSVYPENYLSVAHLRDDVLRDEFSHGKRNKLWERVQKKVEGNANVRPMVREGRSGDVGRVWEWVGVVGLLENSPGEGGVVRRRKSGRVSFADEADLSSSRVMEGSSTMNGDVSERSEGKNMQRWSENRSYY